MDRLQLSITILFTLSTHHNSAHDIDPNKSLEIKSLLTTIIHILEDYWDYEIQVPLPSPSSFKVTSALKSLVDFHLCVKKYARFLKKYRKILSRNCEAYKTKQIANK